MKFEQYWSEIRVERVKLFFLVFLIRPQTKLRKGNIFTNLCQEFCPQWGSVHPQGRHPPGRCPLPRQTPPGRRHTPSQDGHCNGRYASYWNAFFCIILQNSVSCSPKMLILSIDIYLILDL